MTEYLFSEQLRTGLSRFADMDCHEAINSIEFLNEILSISGLSAEEIEYFWEELENSEDEEIEC